MAPARSDPDVNPYSSTLSGSLVFRTSIFRAFDGPDVPAQASFISSRSDILSPTLQYRGAVKVTEVREND